MSGQKERLFNEQLKDIFIGEQINGNSGHINLMNIKSQYFEDKFKELNELVDKKSSQFEDESAFREELYDKLFTFMKKYFSDSGSVYFSYTPLDEKVYEQVYDNNEDVSLFWKTHMLYYVKTGQVWEELEIQDYELGEKEYNIEFNIDNIDGRLANEKKEVIFEVDEIKGDIIRFSVRYSSGREKMGNSRRDDIRKKLGSEYSVDTSKEELRSLFSKFRKQNEVDYFINKNADDFLKEQFDIQLKNYVLDDTTMFSETRLNQIKSIKEIGYELINFVSQFEEELARIWNKPRAVRNSNYVLTIRQLIESSSEEFTREYLKNGDLSQQKEEWFDLEILKETNLSISDIISSHKSLPIDTKYFNKRRLENEIKNIGNKTSGWLIKSENYQAVNTLQNVFSNRVQCLYSDPPFNKKSEAEYEYKVNYKDSTWVTFLENRISVSEELVKSSGSIFVKCDYNGESYVNLLLNSRFGEDNYKNRISLGRVSKQDTNTKKFNVSTESLFLYSMNSDAHKFNHLYAELEEEKDGRWHAMNSQGQGAAVEMFGYSFEPPEGRHWTYSGPTLKEKIEDNEIRIRCRECGEYQYEGEWTGCTECGNKDDVTIQYYIPPTQKRLLDSDWTDIPGYDSQWGFNTEQSKKVIERIIESSTDSGDIILDIFGGSGVTPATAHKMNRKFICTELSSQFYEYILPRMKTVLGSNGIDTHLKNSDTQELDELFKYYELEQYEDILNNMSYKKSESTLSDFSESWDEYMFMDDEKLAGPTISKEDSDINVNLEELYEDIDIPETLSLLVGQPIRNITDEQVILEDDTEDGNEISLENPDIDVVKPLIWWGDEA